MVHIYSSVFNQPDVGCDELRGLLWQVRRDQEDPDHQTGNAAQLVAEIRKSCLINQLQLLIRIGVLAKQSVRRGESLIRGCENKLWREDFLRRMEGLIWIGEVERDWFATPPQDHSINCLGGLFREALRHHEEQGGWQFELVFASEINASDARVWLCVKEAMACSALAAAV